MNKNSYIANVSVCENMGETNSAGFAQEKVVLIILGYMLISEL